LRKKLFCVENLTILPDLTVFKQCILLFLHEGALTAEIIRIVSHPGEKAAWYGDKRFLMIWRHRAVKTPITYTCWAEPIWMVPVVLVKIVQHYYFWRWLDSTDIFKGTVARDFHHWIFSQLNPLGPWFSPNIYGFGFEFTEIFELV
jgi:hypothetical protein